MKMKKLFSAILSLVMVISIIAADFSAFALNLSYGIDVSEHNQAVDYEDVKSDGNKFVMIRLGYGTAHEDKYFLDNVKAAYEAGMDYGIYFYSYAYNTAEAKQEADFVIKTLANLDPKYKEYFTMPVAYDLEDKQIVDRCNKTQITNIMTTFLDTIAGAGYVPMIYANQNWFLNYIDLNTVVAKKYKIWYAYWTGDNPVVNKQIEIANTGVKADMWQYVGRKPADGFDENVIFYTDDLIKSRHIFKLSEVKKATSTQNGEMIYKCSNCDAVRTDVILKASNIKLSRTTINYVGTVQRPSVTVSDSQGNALVYKKDFTVDYSDWNSKDAGEYTVTVKLIGDKYDDSIDYTYTIVPQKNVTPKLNRYIITMTGTVQRPSVTVTDVYGNALTYKKDFTVDYSDWYSTNVGRYTVTVNMQGNYSGSFTYPYYINPRPVSFLSSAQGGFKAVKNGFTLTWKKQTEQTTGYQLQFATKRDFSNAATVWIEDANVTSRTITGRAANTRYYVRIRPYTRIGNGTFYGSWDYESNYIKSIVTL